MYDDEFAGQGGSYVQDPETGKRTLVHRTLDAVVTVPEAALPPPAAAPPYTPPATLEDEPV